MSDSERGLVWRALNRLGNVRERVSSAAFRRHLHLQTLMRDLHLAGSVRCFVPGVVNGQGHVAIEDQCTFGSTLAPAAGDGRVLLQARRPGARIEIGTEAAISNNTSIIANERVQVGARCLIGDGVLIFDSDFHGTSISERRTSTGKTAPVTIGNDVWIGSRAVILRGATLGEGSIVGAGAVVRGTFGALSVIAGNPAQVVAHLGGRDRVAP